MKLRTATSDNLETIWEMWKAIMDQKVYYPYDNSYTKEVICGSWINLNNHVYVAEREDEIVGAYIFKANQPGYGGHIANAAYLVKTTERGQGIGHHLCAHSLQMAKDAGYRAMQFNLVVSTNKGAIKTWLDNGFEIIGTVPEGFYHVEKGYVDAHIFYRKL
ncbi:MAG: GNAT family N-acetyltransferase [Bacteroidota bacterium]